MEFQNVDEALAALNNSALSTGEREQAIHYVQDHSSSSVIERLIVALEDNAFGIRWAAAVALIEIGESALEPLLRAVSERSSSIWLREGAHHVFHYSHSEKVVTATAELLAAMRGSAADVATEAAAYRALQKFRAVRDQKV